MHLRQKNKSRWSREAWNIFLDDSLYTALPPHVSSVAEDPSKPLHRLGKLSITKLYLSHVFILRQTGLDLFCISDKLESVVLVG